MLNVDEIGQRAVEIFETGVCCSESVVYAFAEVFDPENAVKYTRMSSGLCGGMGDGSACGVVTGGACAIGLFCGRNSLEEVPVVKCATISKLYVQAFREHFSQTDCKELKAIIPQALINNERAFCAAIVQWGAEKAAEIILNQKK